MISYFSKDKAIYKTTSISWQGRVMHDLDLLSNWEDILSESTQLSKHCTLTSESPNDFGIHPELSDIL